MMSIDPYLHFGKNIEIFSRKIMWSFIISLQFCLLQLLPSLLSNIVHESNPKIYLLVRVTSGKAAVIFCLKPYFERKTRSLCFVAVSSFHVPSSLSHLCHQSSGRPLKKLLPFLCLLLQSLFHSLNAVDVYRYALSSSHPLQMSSSRHD